MARYSDILTEVGQKQGLYQQNEGGSALGELLQNRNLQQFLAQLGTEIGGEGSVGQMVGEPAQKLIQRQALAEALSRGSNVNLGADGSMKIQQPSGGQQTESQRGSGFNLSDLDIILDGIIGTEE